MRGAARAGQPGPGKPLLTADRRPRLVLDLKVADESPRPDLELGTLAWLHDDPLIPEECAAAGDHSGPGRDPQSDIAYQVEDPNDGAVDGWSVA